MKWHNLTRFVNLCVILFMLFFALVPAGAVIAQDETPPEETPPDPVEIVEVQGGTPGVTYVKFCPGTASVTDGTCMDFSNVDSALTYAQTLTDGAGTIFVSDGFTDPGGNPLDIDENAFLGGTQNILFGLMGGYNFTSGAVTGQSIFQRPVIISNFNNGGGEYTGGLSLMGFIFNTLVNDYTLNVLNSENVEIADVDINASAEDPSGIFMTQSEDVSLDNVNINLDASSPMMGRGIFVNSSNNVSVEDTTIDSANWGMDVDYSEYLSISNMTLNAYRHGINISDSGDFTIYNAVVNTVDDYAFDASYSWGDNSISNSIFHSDYETGMYLYGSEDTMLLDYVQSSNNGGYGLEFFNEYGETGSLTITNSIFSENGDDNIYISLYDDTGYGSFGVMQLPQFTGFDVTIENTTADGANGEEYADGLTLFQYYDGNLAIRESSFSHNDDNGLYIRSNGNVVLENVTANGNLSNSYIQNTMGYYGSAPGGGFGYAEPYVQITGSSFSNSIWSTGLDIYALGDVILEDSVFNNNTYGGLYVYTQSSIYAHCIQANNSSEDETTGARLEAEGLIDISCSEFNNNGGTGLSAWAPAITYSNITATGNAYDQIYWDTENLTEVIGEPCNCSWCTQSSGGGTFTGSPALPYTPPQVIYVYTDQVSGSAQLLGDNTTIFKLMERQPQPPDKELARITLATGVAPAGSRAVMTYKPEADLPGTLPEGSTFVGPAFEFTVTDPDGNALPTLNGFMELRFTLPEGAVVPTGMQYAILHFDEATNEWVQLDTYLSRLYAFAYTAQTGIFTLALVPVP